MKDEENNSLNEKEHNTASNDTSDLSQNTSSTDSTLPQNNKQSSNKESLPIDESSSNEDKVSTNIDNTDYVTQIAPILAQTDLDGDSADYHHENDTSTQDDSNNQNDRQYHYRSRSELNRVSNHRKESLLQRYPYLKYVGYAALIIALCFTAYGGYTLRHANSLLENSYKAREETEFENIDTKKLTRPISILIMGIDNNKERHLDSTRTDSMIVCTYNPKNGYVAMVSIPRDTYMHMEGKGYDTTGKINSAYSVAKEDGAIKAVEQLLDIPIDYYVTVDFSAVQDVVDAFGGIYIDVPFNLTEQNANGKMTVQFKKGKHQLLNGEEALAFSRTRHIDNDIKRGERQQEVIAALADRAMSAGSFTKYAKVLKTLNGNVQTDMNQSMIMSIAKKSMSTGVKIKHYTFKWDSFNYNGESFVSLKENSVKFISHRLRVQLGLDKKDSRDEKGYKLPASNEMDPETYPPYGVTWDHNNDE